MPTFSWADQSFRRMLAFVAIVALHLHFLWGLGQRLASKDHYQFFPIVVIGVGILISLRLKDAKWLEQPALTMRVISYGLVSLLCYAVGTWFTSYWIGALSFLLLIWSAIWYFGGIEMAGLLRGPVALLLLIMPLPLQMDQNLIISMQKVATQSASLLLDANQVSHTTSGVAIRTAERDFMVEDACSGIHSLFSGLTLMAAIAVIFHYSFSRSILVIAQTALWILMANIARVFLVVYGGARWGLELDSGWRHDLLSVLTYLTAILLALSTDQLFRFFIRHDSNSPGLFAMLLAAPIEGFNGLVDRLRISGVWSRRLPQAVLAGAMVPMFVLGLVLSLGRSGGYEKRTGYGVSLESVVGSLELPSQMGQWRLVDRETVERDSDDLMGSSSVIYTYSGNGLTARFSVDGLFPGWHDLGVCYDALGWKSESIENLIGNDGTAGSTKLQLYRGENEYAICWFTCLDSQHRFVQPKAVRSTSFRNLLDRLLTEDLIERQVDIKPPVYQLQLICMREGELLPHEGELLLELFRLLKEELLMPFEDAKALKTNAGDIVQPVRRMNPTGDRAPVAVSEEA